MQEVVSLQQHVAELGVANAVVALFQPSPHRIPLDHLVHREVLPDIPQKLQQIQRTKPVGIVHQQPVVVGRQIEEPRQLHPDRDSILSRRLRRQQHAFGSLAARIANQPRAPADQYQRTMPVPLRMSQRHHRDQAPQMQRISRRVKPHIHRSLPAIQERVKLLARRRLQKSTPPKLFQKTAFLLIRHCFHPTRTPRSCQGAQ